MVKLSGPCFSLANSPPLRKKRTNWQDRLLEREANPPATNKSVATTNGVPDPDVQGLYSFFQLYQGMNVYKRTSPTTAYLFWNSVANRWQIGPFWANGGAAYFLSADNNIYSTYSPHGSATGEVGVAEELV